MKMKIPFRFKIQSAVLLLLLIVLGIYIYVASHKLKTEKVGSLFAESASNSELMSNLISKKILFSLMKVQSLISDSAVNANNKAAFQEQIKKILHLKEYLIIQKGVLVASSMEMEELKKKGLPNPRAEGTSIEPGLDNAFFWTVSHSDKNQNDIYLMWDIRLLQNEEEKFPEAKLFLFLPKSSSWISLNSKKKDRKSTRLNSSHIPLSRMPSSA